MQSFSATPRLLAALSIGVVACVPLVSGAVERIAGIDALASRSGRANVTASLQVVPLGARSARLIVTENSDGRPVRTFDDEMTQRMHLIVIGNDLATFQHDHPALDGRGRFSITVDVPKSGTYQVYADTDPRGLGQQVFRFPVAFGVASPAAAPRVSLAPTGRSTRVGPYRVTLGSLRVIAGRESEVHVSITKDGRPATDLRPYLGGAAHAVFIDARTLAYLHVHPTPIAKAGAMKAMAMPMGADSMPALPPDTAVAPEMALHVDAPKTGAYKLWLQFRGGGTLHVAPFVITAT